MTPFLSACPTLLAAAGSGRAGNLVNPSEHLVEQKWQQLLASVARQAPPAMYFGVSVRNLVMQGLQSCRVLVRV